MRHVAIVARLSDMVSHRSDLAASAASRATIKAWMLASPDIVITQRYLLFGRCVALRCSS